MVIAVVVAVALATSTFFFCPSKRSTRVREVLEFESSAFPAVAVAVENGYASNKNNFMD